MSDRLHEAVPDTWRAWTWTGNGDPLTLALRSVQAIVPGPGEVLVRNAVIGLNPVDWKVLGGDLVDWQPGKVPGVDGAGVVVAVGAGVPDAWIGQRVAYHTNLATPGSFAEYTPVKQRALLRIPQTLDFATAASFPCPALTAWLALDKLPPHAGQRVLVSGAGGAVGHYVVQLAAARGYDVSVMCNARHWARLRSLGARDCFDGPLADHAPSPASLNAQCFAVIDSVNEAHAARLAPALRANGHLVCIQGRVSDWPCAPFGRALSLHEVALGALHQHGDDADWQRLVAAGEQMLQSIADSRIVAEAHVVGDFAALPEQLDALRQRSFSGKPLVAVSH
ncbi:alcohol dehydrogenase catalytic domain-containing protein [Burkholderia sp. Ac-20365]|jgi:NADPH:quinone reductase-like Zn-dependent oxidoreductase|uniref:alcohol dehydrogenase catalytic domain-containing protein n=1 Tax=Burkholderia sp. Ac-20365 TaxID=2703897 RepID=UPI001F1223FA|nr:alcohol dehydrogenase catalytic domain-containing protein [Burkholderia sp. Ac-20365]MBN3766965.1 alcohol dehydrogenase catalytic domain-containing protein [Burkholderia sp. Ac-20365]